MAISTRRQIDSIEKAVSSAFSAVGVTDEVLYAGQIVHTDLVWQNPPLRPDNIRLRGIPITEFYAADLEIGPDALWQFWEGASRVLRSNPYAAYSRGELKGTAKLFSPAYAGQRRFRFSVPESYPNPADDYSLLMLALECADLAMQATPLKWVSDESNHYVELLSGDLLGVVNGRISGMADCQDFSGMVEEFLSMPRGLANTTCQYDTLAKVRSVLWEKKDLFGPDFMALDYLLQLLRTLDVHNSVGTILKPGYVSKIRRVAPDIKLQALDQALATMRLTGVPDRNKIYMLKDTLVPTVMGSHVFNRRIYSLGKKIPFVLADKTLERIQTTLLSMKEELTCTNEKP